MAFALHTIEYLFDEI